MTDFQQYGLNESLRAALARMDYKTPTPVQAQAIPPALQGRDIMGSAQTGTGKTAAFAIPLVQHLLNNPDSTALVLTPTRELGKQIMDIMHQLLGYKSKIKTAFIIGGAPMNKQLDMLKQNPRLVVGTPGRINDHLERRTIRFDKTDFLVLDETDRMLDMGFSVQLDKIFKFLPQKRQTLMFSATLPKNILNMAQQYLTDPQRIAVGSTVTPAKNISQVIVKLTEDQKYPVLVEQLESRKGSVVIFVKTKYGTERLAKRLNSANAGFTAEAIHGDLKQNRRDRVIRDYRQKKYRILVATDVVARGLDIPHIEHVINYDLPQVPEDYIHRIGRTARAGASGEALCLITPQDGRKWHAIEKLIDPDATGSAGADNHEKRRGGRGGQGAGAGKKRRFGTAKRNADSKGSTGRKTPYTGKTAKGGGTPVKGKPKVKNRWSTAQKAHVKKAKAQAARG